MEAINLLILYDGISKEFLSSIAFVFGAELAGISPAAKAKMRHCLFGGRAPKATGPYLLRHQEAWEAITANENDTRIPEPAEDGTGI